MTNNNNSPPRKTTGIYSIRNLVTGDLYIGSSKDIRVRLETHLKDLRGDRHHSEYLQRAWNKYEEGNFEFKCIDELLEGDSNERLIEVEQFWIDVLQPTYNMSKIAGRVEFTEEVRRKISQHHLLTGHRPPIHKKGSLPPWTSERREKTVRSMVGRKRSLEHRQNLSRARTGVKTGPISEEGRRNISSALKKVWSEKRKKGPWIKKT